MKFKFKELLQSKIANPVIFVVENSKEIVRRKVERLIIWAMQSCMNNQTIALLAAFNTVGQRANQFEADVKYVATDHWKHINDLDARLRAIESREQ